MTLTSPRVAGKQAGKATPRPNFFEHKKTLRAAESKEGFSSNKEISDEYRTRKPRF